MGDPIEEQNDRNGEDANSQQSETNPQNIPVNNENKGDTGTRISFWTAVFTFLYLATTVGIYWNSNDTYKEIKKQFAIANEPVIMIGKTVAFNVWDTLGYKPIITFRIDNFSNRPIHVDSAICGYRFNSKVPTQIFTKEDSILYPIRNTFEIREQEAYLEEKFRSKIAIDEISRNNIRNGNERPLVFGVIFYRDYISAHEKFYFFSVTVNPLEISEIAKQARITNNHISDNIDTIPKYITNDFLLRVLRKIRERNECVSN